MLTFFFDGVPGATALRLHVRELRLFQPILQTRLWMLRQLRVLLFHYPYEEKECASCHNEHSLGNMVEPQPGLCYLCHEDLGAQYNYLHGPVAGGYCTACHDPHSSDNEKLLGSPGISYVSIATGLKVFSGTKCMRIWKECYAPIATIPTGEKTNIYFNRPGD